MDICAGKAEGWKGEPSEDLGEEPLVERKEMQRCEMGKHLVCSGRPMCLEWSE